MKQVLLESGLLERLVLPNYLKLKIVTVLKLLLLICKLHYTALDWTAPTNTAHVCSDCRTLGLRSLN